ncbi:hypothetical protein MPPM_3321 [Methylorubrum populi]|uniref:Uncharacterized protein n=1 Tax=Methylorubrum populi TaxID=223967 RepID=A0A160PGM7_9HYPH|nr:hypothetical protein [Methylorubrum populi]BAU91926.1 hypothetical protein MPPM_3321 [Methylorubrum populi]
MSARILSIAFVALAVSAGAASAGDRGRTIDQPRPETTGSIGRSSGPIDFFAPPPYDPRDLGPRAASRSSFNADTARARHYVR